jgi:hypothetical protein
MMVIETSLDPYEELKKDLNDAFFDALTKARLWMVVYIIIRASMIVFSVLTSADAVNAVTPLSSARPFFGILVALLAAFDAWLKPDLKYRIHYTANDTYTRLKRKLSRVPKPDDPNDQSYPRKLEQISDEFDETNKKFECSAVI